MKATRPWGRPHRRLDGGEPGLLEPNERRVRIRSTQLDEHPVQIGRMAHAHDDRVGSQLMAAKQCDDLVGIGQRQQGSRLLSRSLGSQCGHRDVGGLLGPNIGTHHEQGRNDLQTLDPLHGRLGPSPPLLRQEALGIGRTLGILPIDGDTVAKQMNPHRRQLRKRWERLPPGASSAFAAVPHPGDVPAIRKRSRSGPGALRPGANLNYNRSKFMAPARKDQLVAVDLGSNSFHMLIARVVSGQLAVIDRMKERVQLAAGFDEHNNLTEEAMGRGIACLERFGQRLASLQSIQVRAVGTNTLRKAKNADVFLQRAETALGHPIEIISGREEARIIYLGVAHTVADDVGRRLVVDIGGGSTEVILGERFEAKKMESLHMGCVSHTLRFFAEGKLTRSAFRDAITAARVELETFERSFRKTGWVSAVGSSGTITAIDELLRTNGWSDRGITREGLRHLREALIDAGRLSKVSLAGLSAERVSVLPGGLSILMGVFKSLKITRMTASAGALREGLLYDTIGRSTHEDVRVQTIDRLMERYAVDRGQASRVEATALRCLDQVAYAWDLHHPDLRWMLSWAARLHEVGLALSYSGYQRHSAYIVRNSEMPGFSKNKQALLAALIGAHRRSLKPAVTGELRNAGGEAAVHLAILLRLAATLNRSRDPHPPPPLTLTAAGNTLELVFPEEWLSTHPMTRTDLENERDYLASAGYTFEFE